MLFVGGPKDGMREEIPRAPGCVTFQCYVQQVPKFMSTSIRYDVHTYTLKKCVLVDGSECMVAVHSSVPDLQAQLVKGYRYHRKKRYR